MNFASYGANDVFFQRSDNDLLISIGSTADTLRIDDWYGATDGGSSSGHGHINTFSAGLTR